MKIFFAITFALVSLLPTLAFAQAGSDSTNPLDRLTTVGEGLDIASENPEPNFAVTIGKIIQVFISISGAIMMIYLVYAGYLWLTASGEEEKITKAKAIIRGSIIGIIIVFSAYIITAAVIDQMTSIGSYSGGTDAADTGA